MKMSPEVGPEMPEQEINMPFVRVDMDKATAEDYKKLEELGWTKGSARHGGEMDFLWEKDGEPALPADLDGLVIGTKNGKIEYAEKRRIKQ